MKEFYNVQRAVEKTLRLTFCGFAMAGLKITKLQILTKDE